MSETGTQAVLTRAAAEGYPALSNEFDLRGSFRAESGEVAWKGAVERWTEAEKAEALRLLTKRHDDAAREADAQAHRARMDEPPDPAVRAAAEAEARADLERWVQERPSRYEQRFTEMCSLLRSILGALERR